MQNLNKRLVFHFPLMFRDIVYKVAELNIALFAFYTRHSVIKKIFPEFGIILTTFALKDTLPQRHGPRLYL